MKLVFLCAVLFVGLSVSADVEPTWNCTFSSNGQNYDFTSQANCTDTTSATCENGMYVSQDDKQNKYYFRLCDPTESTPNANVGSECKPKTQVCQLDGNNFDTSCGIGPPDYSLISDTETQGVTQKASSGDVCTSTSTGRVTSINLKCPSAFSRTNLEIDEVIEVSTCVYSVDLYLTSACGKKKNDDGDKPTGLSGGSIFLIIFFVSLFVYFAAGIGYNAYKGNEGLELIPNLEFWKDLPFLVKDGIMFCVGLCTGKGYDSV
mmetsp:Transcript_12408/g.16609  ORF Transcript_12408/g.16609 Transcript_12408/m.16609 type:complete len:262 (+) Transcript_12408:150-935(+)|eukprot:CAMPEP_0201474950 /NCGR_PEP_ID=MMETSP0151_2-20130828/437_1 /ASSEMBLY_ACC=CAM_ASM_000257 /TAXON_ID=200890 /ORGANISM="Paramoeba atlantica, Strain 621/1 / CCAP 1560/9" /LENGTH=261 /DNA_ID=CAMNT_0047854915 /DNA_START=140 /DNA_END=925 /DNA_ORIENTATION=+